MASKTSFTNTDESAWHGGGRLGQPGSARGASRDRQAETKSRRRGQQRTFFEEVGDFGLAELAHIVDAAVVPQERQHVVGKHVGIGVRAVACRTTMTMASAGRCQDEAGRGGHHDKEDRRTGGQEDRRTRSRSTRGNARVLKSLDNPFLQVLRVLLGKQHLGLVSAGYGASPMGPCALRRSSRVRSSRGREGGPKLLCRCSVGFHSIETFGLARMQLARSAYR